MTRIDPHGYTGGPSPAAPKETAMRPGSLTPRLTDSKQITAAALANLWAWPRWVTLGYTDPQ